MITFIKLLKENKTQFFKKNLKMTIFNNKIVEFSCFYILINIINHILQFAEGDYVVFLLSASKSKKLQFPIYTPVF